MQRGPTIRRVERHPALKRLRFECTPRRDERGQVGDGVVHAEAGTVTLCTERLVEITCPRRVDRYQLDGLMIDPGAGRGVWWKTRSPIRSLGGFRHRLRRMVVGYAELAAKCLESDSQLQVIQWHVVADRRHVASQPPKSWSMNAWRTGPVTCPWIWRAKAPSAPMR